MIGKTGTRSAQQIGIVLVAICFVVLPRLVIAQNIIASGGFFRERFRQWQEFSPGMSPAPAFRASWTEELEIRTETEEFEWERQRYTLRISPGTPGIRQAQHAGFDLLMREADLERRTYSYDFIELAYKDWLSVYELQRRLAIHRKFLLLFQDIETVHLKMASMAELHAKELLEVQSDIATSEMAIQNLEFKLTRYLGAARPDFSDLIPLDSIERWFVHRPNSVLPAKRIEQEAETKSAALAAKIALEQAERNRIFDYFQVQYEGPHDNELKERLSVGVGLKFEFSSDSRLKIEELKVEQALAQEKLAVERALLREKIARKRRELEEALQLLRLHESLQTVRQQRASRFIQNTTREEGSGPLLLLYYKVETVKQEREYLELELAAYRSYIDYLIITEQLFEKPFHNFLVSANCTR